MGISADFYIADLGMQFSFSDCLKRQKNARDFTFHINLKELKLNLQVLEKKQWRLQWCFPFFAAIFSCWENLYWKQPKIEQRGPVNRFFFNYLPLPNRIYLYIFGLNIELWIQWRIQWYIYNKYSTIPELTFFSPLPKKTPITPLLDSWSRC